MNNLNVSQQDLAYIAGLFDGEGSTGIYHPCALQVSFHMGGKEGLSFIIACFGGSLGIQPGKHEYNTPMFVLTYSAVKAEQFLRLGSDLVVFRYTA